MFKPITLSVVNLWAAALITLCSASSLKAQSLLTEPTVWLKPDSKNASTTDDFIGNYNTLSIKDPVIEISLKSISKYKSGTLFLVGKFPEQKDFLSFGSISLNALSASAGQHNLHVDTAISEAYIYKISYTISPNFKKKDNEYYIDENILLSEVLFYDKVLSLEESRKIETYLALKYSVNITANTKENLRNYVSLDNDKLWNYSIDAFYDEQVLGLGRNDSIGLYQTQTYSSDSKSTRLSFNNDKNLGEKPAIELIDESFLIFSEKNKQMMNLPCGGSTEIQPWKIHFHKWIVDNPNEVYLWVDTVFNEEVNYYITDGFDFFTVESIEENNGTQISIPFSGLDFTRNYFLVWEKQEPACDPLVKVLSESCEVSVDQTNTIRIEVNEEALNAQVYLVNNTDGVRYEFEMTENSGLLKNLNSGQYELVVFHDGNNIFNKVYRFNSCGNEPAQEVDFSQKATTDGNAFGISMYPNPVAENNVFFLDFWGFSNSEFTLHLTDLQGRTIKTSTFIYTESSSTFNMKISHNGVYNLRISSGSYSEVKRIIVQ